VLIVETEIWPNFLAEALRRGVRIAFANARLSERRWARTRVLVPLVQPLLSRVTACAAQSEADLERWAYLGVPREALCVSGNTKYDAVTAAPSEPDRVRRRAAARIPDGLVVCAWGSLRPGEEPAVIAAARALEEQGRAVAIVAVPRHPEQAHETRLALVRAGLDVSDWRPGEAWPQETHDRGRPSAIWVPALGVLRDVYAIADVAVVGGTFAPYGGHNAAEPALAGVPVIVGPHIAGIRDVVEALTARGGGRVAITGREVADQVVRWTESDRALADARTRARRSVEDLAGASARTLGFLEARGFWG
jgi:3-deoxy-D-manno-octulosonic-acid transferase